MAKGKIKVQTENIFPIIKKFLYSDHEIFLRELISNAVDATQKLKAFSSLGEVKGDLGDLTIEVELDKKKKTISIKDKGIGMSADEVKKYINQIAFSGAEEFLDKYKDKADGTTIIGHFGLGFYSSFMVAEKVEINTKTHREGESAVHWSCDGSPEYLLKDIDKTERGTEIILHIAKDSEEFLEDVRIQTLLDKYCKFMPIPIKFGTKKEYVTKGEGENAKKEEIIKDNIINNPTPAWTKTPSDLKDEEYKSFYRELYPTNYEPPLFHIHLNVDYPFNLTGILYFPKLKKGMEMQRSKIQLYCNQVFVTDSVEGIVPDFLTLLHGVIDSPDIPLNVSRSYLQSDSNVKKISGHIAKKVADKLEEMFKKDRKDFEQKWDDISMFMEYGIVAEEKFYDRAKKIVLFKNTDGAYFTSEEYIKKVEKNQTDKDKKTVFLYTNNPREQHDYIESAKAKNYDVLVFESPLTSHFLGMLEQKMDNVVFARVDSDTLENLINQEEVQPSKLTEKQEEALKPIVEGVLPDQKFTVVFQSLSEKDRPMMVTESEFVRRMNEMSAVGGGSLGLGKMPEMHNLVVNSNHPLISKILDEKDEAKKKDMAKQAADLALLSKNLLKGEDLTKFINRSLAFIEK